MAAKDTNVRTLVFPNGGTMDIPLPGSNARFALRPGSALNAPDGSSRIPIFVALAIGLVIGVTATAWYFHRR